MNNPLPKIHFSLCLQLCFGLLLGMIGLFFYYVWSEKQIDAAHEQRHATHALTDELRQTSDDLTRMIRSYAVTGEPRFLDYFQQIRAIRNGSQPRPASYNSIYWDKIIAGIQPAATPQEQAVPLLDLMKQAGFTETELAKLTEAKEKSDQLTETELKAFSLLESPAAVDDAALRQQAKMLLFDRDYHQRKADIMTLIDQVVSLSEQRTQARVEHATRWALLMRMALIGLGGLLLLLIGLCEKLFSNTLGAKPETIYELLTQLGRERFASSPDAKAYPKNSIMGQLLLTQKNLQMLEDIRQQNRQSLPLMAKVFAESQEGIFLTDAQGVVLDVNPAFERITGRTRAESLGKHAAILHSDQHDQAFYAELWEQVKQHGHWRGEIWNRTQRGERFASILSFSAVMDNDDRLSCYLGMLTDITPLKLHQQEMEKLAYHDALTSLPNRPLLADRMQQALARVDRNKEILSIVCLDLDGFKAVNDSFGHGTGDALLVEVGHRLLNCVRSGDTVARMGGDEFAILLCEISSREHCEITLRRILKALLAPYNLCGQHITEISASIGYTLFPLDNADPDTLLRHADHAMYDAKQAGKNRFHYFDYRDTKQNQANWMAVARLEKALHNQEFCLYVQPKLQLATGQVIGAEALVRWRHPLRGLTQPDEFLPLLENADIAIAFGEWVIDQALAIMQDWHEHGLDLPLSVNIGGYHLRQHAFVARLTDILRRYPHLPTGRLELEMVESAALDDLHEVGILIGQCQQLGVDFALDDFGTGFSALSYLKHLPVKTLKIDRSFVGDLLEDENNLAIVRGVIGMAKAFDMRVIAEGVENWLQARCLLELGCDVAQGYVIAHPMPAPDLVGWTRQFRMPNFKENQT